MELAEFLKILENGDTKILDVRDSWETPFVQGQQVTQIPIHQITQNLDAISKTEDLIVMCQHGVRSKQVIHYLVSQHGFTNLINLTGGVHLWRGK